jgi:small-conductance mechanosensitive channel/CRP-like cAMP-binding protein
VNFLPWIALVLFAGSIALWKPLPHSRGRFRASLGFLTLWLVLWAGTSVASYWHLDVAVAQRIGLALVELAAVQMLAGALFDLAVNRTRLPRFAVEMALIACYVLILFKLFYSLGVNVTGIFATSAVATAVVGLALQDMMSNIASGIALEFENSVRVGDFIQCGDSKGWVKHVRLRHTMIETPDGDRIMLPNSLLTRTSVTVMTKPRRQFISFAMPYTHPPHEVIDIITFALQASPIPGVAAEPAPVCVVREMTPHAIQYAAVVWIARPGHDTVAVSAVLNRIYFALQRAGIPLGEFTHLLEMRSAVDDRAAATNQVEIVRRTPLFRALEEQELFALAAQLRHLSFGPGEFIIRQGDAGDSMYFVTAGQVAINYVGLDQSQVDVAVISPGDFFGEASLLTGVSRSANAIAASRVDCFRLDKSGLEHIISNRPNLVEDISRVMAHRQTELAAKREKLDAESALLREAEQQVQLLSRIRKFFEVGTNTASA